MGLRPHGAGSSAAIGDHTPNGMPAEALPPVALELADVEVTTLPMMVFFKIKVAIVPTGLEHHVMKRYADLVDLHRALQREVVSADWLLPRPPDAVPMLELAGLAFRRLMGAYLSRLGRCREASETHSFLNFFQLSNEYRRWGDSNQGDVRLDSRPTLCDKAVTTFRGQQELVSDKRHSCAQAPSSSSSGMARPTAPQRTQLVPQVAGTAHGQVPPRGTPPTAGPASAVTAPIARHIPRAPGLPLGAMQHTGASSGEVESSMEDAGGPISPTGSASSNGVFASTGAVGSAPRRSRVRRPACIVCMARPQEVAIDPCGHVSMCGNCSQAVRNCPMCRGPISKVLRVYIS